MEPVNLEVLLGATRVGTISRLPGGDRSIFIFDDDYLAAPHRPTLSLRFKGRDGGIAHQPRAYNKRVEPFFAGLLPEGRLRDYVAERSGIHCEREFPLLDALGDDLPGAVLVRAADASGRPGVDTTTETTGAVTAYAPINR